MPSHCGSGHKGQTPLWAQCVKAGRRELSAPATGVRKEEGRRGEERRAQRKPQPLRNLDHAGSLLERQPRSTGSRDCRGNSGTQRDSGSCGLPPASVTPALGGARPILAALLYLCSRSGQRASAYRAVQRLFPPVTRSTPAAPLSPCLRHQHRSPQRSLHRPPALQDSPAFCTASQRTGVSSLGGLCEVTLQSRVCAVQESTTLVSI